MKTVNGNQPASENNPAILAVIFGCRTDETRQQVIACIRAVHENVALIIEESSENERGDASDLPAAVIRIEPGAGRGAAIKTAARRARRMGMTHIVTLDADRLPPNEQMAKFFSAAASNGDAIVIGRRDKAPAATGASGRISAQRRVKNFWFRLQTGIRLQDAGSRLRCYPLVVLEHLTVRANRNAFDTEVLTRAAWAAVAIKEVGIDVPDAAATRQASFRHSLRSGLGVFLLNVHLTMRSITPLPHRKIVLSGDRAEEKISVLRPLKSIRALLTENVTPIQLSAAAAMGVFLGALPLIALHTVVILFVSSYFRLNKVATLAASQLCMPPFVPALCIEAGYFLRHGAFLTEISLETLGYQALERLWEWLLGSLVVAPVLAALVGGLVFVVSGLISKSMRLKVKTAAQPRK